MPEITVAITTHNLESYLELCIEELLNQTFQDFEIVVYDDLSTDRTRAILAKYQTDYAERIYVILGAALIGKPAGARNAILESGAIQGRYLLFLDGDDRIEPDFLEKLYRAAEYCNADLAICAYDRFEDGSGHVLCQEMRGFPAEMVLPPESDILAFINGSLWNKLIRVSCIGALRIPDIKVGEDISFFMALLERCQTLVFVDDILIHYRVHAASVISNIKEETIYQFADELAHLHDGTSYSWMRDTLSLATFIHIGISMPVHACKNPDIDLGVLLNWISKYFSVHFSGFRHNKWLCLSSLLHHGVKGLGLWIAKQCYRLHCMSLFLALYQLYANIFHAEIKF